MSVVLVDSNVLLDVISEDPEWGAWSAKALVECAESSVLAINPLIYAEVSMRFGRVEELDVALPEDLFRRDPLPWRGGVPGRQGVRGVSKAGRTETVTTP